MVWSRQGLIVAITTIAVIVSAGFVVARVSAGDANPGRGLTLDLYGGLTDFNGVAMPSSPGEETFIGRDLYQLADDGAPAPEGERIGRLVGMCTLVTSNEGVCHGVVNLDGRGTIALYLEVKAGSGDAGLAVIGGTGEFAGASGAGEELPVPGNPSDHYLRIHLSGFSAP